ncbi:MAG TPA: NAD(P)/FAD-dependent oxidoreductase [Allosphingosinicella sp.]|nr:NAD(P)/FAD-dependent oxidoreductase [Allosphingosinicella sp.]
MNYDVVVVGAGPAGLNAALILGRCCRSVLLCDEGKPRNAAASKLHGFLSRDGIEPLELLRLGRGELAAYDARILDAEVVSARCLSDEAPHGYPTAFEVTLGDGQRFTSRKLLLATGLQDELPSLEGLRRYYGRGVYHCPYCDGWEHRGGSLVAYGRGGSALALALSLRTWSERVTLCTAGSRLSREDRLRLERSGIGLRQEPVVRLEGSEREDLLQRVVFERGAPLGCDAFFFSTRRAQHSALPLALGCELDDKGEIRTQEKQKTGVPGLYLAGDADGDVQFAIVAAGEGASAAVAINLELQAEDERAAYGRAEA